MKKLEWPGFYRIYCLPGIQRIAAVNTSVSAWHTWNSPGKARALRRKGSIIGSSLGLYFPHKNWPFELFVEATKRPILIWTNSALKMQDDLPLTVALTGLASDQEPIGSIPATSDLFPGQRDNVPFQKTVRVKKRMEAKT